MSQVSFDLSEAVRRNRFWASSKRQVKHGPKRLVWQGQGWGPIYGAIAAWLFGEYDPPPSPERFAHIRVICSLPQGLKFVEIWERESGNRGIRAQGIERKGRGQKLWSALALVSD